jgi:hypothetical protein
MASKNTPNTVDGDIILIRELAKHLKYTETETKFMTRLAKKGIIAVESLLEEAISKVGKLERSHVNGQDFTDGSDAKKSVVTCNDAITEQRASTISNIKNKNGTLRIMISDPCTKEIFYFKVPNEELKNKKCIKIFFHKNGGMPMKIQQKTIIRDITKDTSLYLKSFNERAWLKYRVNTFKELCN